MKQPVASITFLRYNIFMRRLPAILILFVFQSLACAQALNTQACFKHVCVSCEVADDNSSRQSGLMFRKALPDNKGMLFVFEEESRPSFWMKNMLFPLDIIWISKDDLVVGLSKGVKPCAGACESISPQEKIKYAVEVGAGFVDKYKIGLGDRVYFNQ